jgi:hypothetical protein
MVYYGDMNTAPTLPAADILTAVAKAAGADLLAYRRITADLDDTRYVVALRRTATHWCTAIATTADPDAGLTNETRGTGPLTRSSVTGRLDRHTDAARKAA